MNYANTHSLMSSELENLQWFQLYLVTSGVMQA